MISPRVERVGGDRFAIVCIDPAKHRSEWMMADYFGNLLIERQTLEHRAAFFKLAVEQVQQAQQQHDIQDLIVVVERTGNYHLAPKRAFAAAGFETRVVHPVATRQYRMPADPGNKTDETDLYAQHRAAVAGFGLFEAELESPYRELRLRVRHRRNLVEKAAALACQIRDHLHVALPGYADMFDSLLQRTAPLAIARRCDSPAMMLQLGQLGLQQLLREQNVRHQLRIIDRILAWATQAPDDVPDRTLHHAIWTDLHELYQHFQRRIATLEQQLASDVVRTPYVRLLAIPGINVVSAAELAGEMGPITRYANANAITGRSGLFPSRHQSDQKDHDSGPMFRRQANRRLRCVLMRVADNLACHCDYYRGQAGLDQSRGVDKRAARVRIAKRFSRLILACVAGEEPMRHPCFQKPDSILEKLRSFHHEHATPISCLIEDLHVAVTQLPYNTRRHEARVAATVLEQQTKRHRDGVALGELLPAVLERLGVNRMEEQGDRS